jgi:hypothetical protein
VGDRRSGNRRPRAGVLVPERKKYYPVGFGLGGPALFDAGTE